MAVQQNSDETINDSNTDVDIAIVGAGPAGLYVAWRLLQEPTLKSKTIALFDAADRTGGRVLSVSLPEVPYVSELGAMRYVPEQVLVQTLIEEKLQLDTVEFQFDTTGYLLRGMYVSHNELNTLPYNVDASEKGKSPIQLIVLAILRALRDLDLPEVESEKEAKGLRVAALREKLKTLNEETPPDNLVTYFSGHEWRLIKRFGCIDGRRLYQMGFWDLVQRYLTQEGYHLAHDGSGYQSILSMWNAADALVWYLADFTGSPYKTIISGMGELIQRLEHDIRNRAIELESDTIGVINLGWALKHIELVRSESTHFNLGFRVGEFLPSSSGISYKTISTRKVILALPQPALKAIGIKNLQIEADDSGDQATMRFNALLDSVTANSLFKAFIVYEQPWWNDEATPTSFRMFTDLPLRQVYHFGTNRQCPSMRTTTDRRPTCLLLVYSDSRYAEYWKRLDQMSRGDQKYYLGRFEDSLDSDARQKFQNTIQDHGTGEAVLTRLQDQLRQLSEKSTLPDPITIIAKHWSDPPFYGGWHAWNMGYRSWVIAERLVQPFLDAELFTCGEAFSSEQGWIEGALKSAERVLERLGIGPPEWVNKARYQEQRALWL